MAWPSEKQDLINKQRIDFISTWKANMLDKTTAIEIAKQLEIEPSTLYAFIKAHRKEIDYATEQKRKEFMPELKNMSMKALANRLNKSDKALQIALEITGAYVPKSEQTQTIRNETEQKAYVESLLEKIKRQEGKGNQEVGNGPPGEEAL